MNKDKLTGIDKYWYDYLEQVGEPEPTSDEEELSKKDMIMTWLFILLIIVGIPIAIVITFFVMN